LLLPFRGSGIGKANFLVASASNYLAVMGAGGFYKKPNARSVWEQYATGVYDIEVASCLPEAIVICLDHREGMVFFRKKTICGTGIQRETLSGCCDKSTPN